MWVCYPIIHIVERRLPLSLGIEGCALRFRCRDFNFFTLTFRNEAEGKDVFESVQKLTCVGTFCRIVFSSVLTAQRLQISYMLSSMTLDGWRNESMHGGSTTPQRSLRGWVLGQGLKNGDLRQQIKTIRFARSLFCFPADESYVRLIQQH